MPTLGLREAFAKRGLDPNRATALDMYAIACNFGVGQATLVNHLAYGINMINQVQRDRLGRITPKMIRTELLGEVVSTPLTVADQHWNSPTLDMEQDALLLLPSGVVVDASMLVPSVSWLPGDFFALQSVASREWRYPAHHGRPMSVSHGASTLVWLDSVTLRRLQMTKLPHSIGPLLVDEPDISRAWAKAVLHVIDHAGPEISP